MKIELIGLSVTKTPESTTRNLSRRSARGYVVVRIESPMEVMVRLPLTEEQYDNLELGKKVKIELTELE